MKDMVPRPSAHAAQPGAAAPGHPPQVGLAQGGRGGGQVNLQG
jgi:hypothetical protein